MKNKNGFIDAIVRVRMSDDEETNTVKKCVPSIYTPQYRENMILSSFNRFL